MRRLKVHAKIARMMRDSDAAWERLRVLAPADSAAGMVWSLKSSIVSTPKPTPPKPVRSTMLMLAALLFSPKMLDQIFEQMVAEYRVEHLEEFQDGRVWGARVTRIRWWWAFVNTALFARALALVNQIMKALKGLGR